jgi:hypothetical protein
VDLIDRFSTEQLALKRERGIADQPQPSELHFALLGKRPPKI